MTLGNLMPNISTVIASSTTNMTDFFNFVWPVIPIAFALAAVIIAIRFVLNLFDYLFAKLTHRESQRELRKMGAKFYDDQGNEVKYF